MIDKRIEFDEKYVSEEYGTTTLYFTAQAEILKQFTDKNFPEAECMEISVEFPTNTPEAKEAGVSISPTKWDKEEDAYVDYDWFDVELSYPEIEELIALAEREERKNGN